MQAFEPQSPIYSAAIAADGWLHLSGQIATDDDGRARGDCRAQTTRCLTKIDALLSAAGATRRDMVKLTSYLVDAADYPAYAAAKAAWLADQTMAPAGTAVIVARLLVPGARIEIEAIARLPG